MPDPMSRDPEVTAAIHAAFEAWDGCEHIADKGYGAYAMCEDPDAGVPVRLVHKLMHAAGYRVVAAESETPDLLQQTAWPGYEWHQHADGEWCQRKLAAPTEEERQHDQ